MWEPKFIGNKLGFTEGPVITAVLEMSACRYIIRDSVVA